MYYPDLSPYQLRGEFSILGTLNMGWLDKEHVYTQGDVSDEFLDRLFQYCANPVMKTRGYHRCSFCEESSHYGMVHVRRGAEEAWIGSGQIRVVFGDKVYAAPDLIYHYVSVHRYKPSDEFIEAVLQGPLPDSRKYKALKNKYWRF